MAIIETPASLAQRDQADAKERDWERRTADFLLLFLFAAFALGVYSFLAARGDVPAAPWSPIGQHRQEQKHKAPMPPVEDSRQV